MPSNPCRACLLRDADKNNPHGASQVQAVATWKSMRDPLTRPRPV